MKRNKLGRYSTDILDKEVEEICEELKGAGEMIWKLNKRMMELNSQLYMRLEMLDERRRKRGGEK